MKGKNLNYQNIQLGTFLNRPNRFIAHCLLNGKEVITHVKNTGRGKEVFLKGATVGLVYDPNPKRKTHYDLVSIKKGEQWLNIDSQLPNALVAEGLQTQKIILPNMPHLRKIKREVFYEDSKFDFYLSSEDKAAFLEVKGMTLENHQVGAFPDAPTTRGLKHVLELKKASLAGFQTYLFFLAQSSEMKVATIHKSMQPELAEAIGEAQEVGTEVICYNCFVEPGSVTLHEKIPFSLDYPFVDPNAPL